MFSVPWRAIGLGCLSITVAGCGSTLSSHSEAARWQKIAPGVELRVEPEAGAEAQRIADEIRTKYSAELVSATPVVSRGWPASDIRPGSGL